MIKLKRNIILFSISVFLLISCTSSQYIEPKQLDAETSAKSILSNNINDQKLIAYLSRYNLIIPDKDDYWNSDLLVMISLFNNTSRFTLCRKYISCFFVSDIRCLISVFFGWPKTANRLRIGIL